MTREKRLGMAPVILAGLLSMLTFSTFSHAGALYVDSGAMTINGQTQIRYKATDISKFNEGNLDLNINVGFGYFVIDGLELGFQLSSRIGFLGAKAPKGIGIGPSLTYFFDTNSIVYPYLGGLFTINWSYAENPYFPGKGYMGSLWNVGLKPMFGVAIALNKYVALDFGIDALFNLPLSGFPTTPPETPAKDVKTQYNYGFNGSAGYAGVMVFF